jgi:hypothetical protein
LLDYLPEILAADRRIFPSLDWYARILGGHTSVTTVPIPHDCTDGFLGAYWRRPAVYLDPTARSAISSMAKLGDLEPGLARLRRDLDSGVWQQRPLPPYSTRPASTWATASSSPTATAEPTRSNH